jgi:type II secretory pathway component GspD/PulD (secretin)
VKTGKKQLDIIQKDTVFMPLITILVIFCYSIVYAANEESNTLVFQRATFTANLEEESLKNVFEKLQKETGIWVRVPESELDERVSVQFENLAIEEGLRRILHTMNYSFLFDQDNNLIGAFVFGKANRNRNATDRANLEVFWLDTPYPGR